MKGKFTYLLAAIIIGMAGKSSGQNPPPKYDPASVERGQANFKSTCGFCHGATAKGGEKGPDLLRSVLVLDDEGGKSIGAVVLKGRPDKGMPRFPLTPAQITDIANFLHDSIEKAKDRDNYKILNIVTGDAKAGEAYFNGAGRCRTCHSLTGDLQGIGKKYEPVTLQGKIVNPQMADAITFTVTLPNGERFTGAPIYYDDFSVSLRSADGVYHSFKRNRDVPKVEINNKLQGHLDLLSQYTDSGIHNLTAYLVTVK